MSTSAFFLASESSCSEKVEAADNRRRKSRARVSADGFASSASAEVAVAAAPEADVDEAVLLDLADDEAEAVVLACVACSRKAEMPEVMM